MRSSGQTVPPRAITDSRGDRDLPGSRRSPGSLFRVTVDWSRSRNHLFWALVVGLLLRVALIPHPSYLSDVDAFIRWANTLTQNPLSQVYTANPDIDHLPGDMWIHLLLSHLYRGIWGEFTTGSFPYGELMKIPPILGDLALVILSYRIIRRTSGSRRAPWAAWFIALNPALIFISALWGQWDSISAAVAVLAFYLVQTGRWQWAFPALTYATLIKPQLIALVPVIALVVLLVSVLPLLPVSIQRFLSRIVRTPEFTHRPDPATVLLQWSIAVASSIVVFIVVCLPFQVGFPPIIGSVDIRDRLNTALELYRGTTYGAMNLWRTPLTVDLVRQQGEYFPDSNTFLFGQSFRHWGTFLSVLGVGTVLVTLLLRWRRVGLPLMYWAGASAMFVLFMVPTRIHERYFVPALVLTILLAFMAPRLIPLAIALSITCTFNLVQAFDRNYNIMGTPTYFEFVFKPWFAPLISTINVILLVALLWSGIRTALKPAARIRQSPVQRIRLRRRSNASESRKRPEARQRRTVIAPGHIRPLVTRPDHDRSMSGIPGGSPRE